MLLVYLLLNLLRLMHGMWWVRILLNSVHEIFRVHKTGDIIALNLTWIPFLLILKTVLRS